MDQVRFHSERNIKGEMSGIATGYTELDKMTSGLQSGDLVVFASRPGMGKSSLALNIAEYVCVDLGLPIPVVSG